MRQQVTAIIVWNGPGYYGPQQNQEEEVEYWLWVASPQAYPNTVSDAARNKGVGTCRRFDCKPTEEGLIVR